MNRDTEKLNKRRCYIRDTIENKSTQSTTKTVKQLSKELFLSQSTIWKDLAKAYKSDLDKIE